MSDGKEYLVSQPPNSNFDFIRIAEVDFQIEVTTSRYQNFYGPQASATIFI